MDSITQTMQSALLPLLIGATLVGIATTLMLKPALVPQAGTTQPTQTAVAASATARGFVPVANALNQITEVVAPTPSLNTLESESQNLNMSVVNSVKSF